MLVLTCRTSAMVVDASVAVPWFVDTPFSRAARQLKRETSRSPNLVLLETTNSLLKYVRDGQLPKQDAYAAMKALPIALNELVADNALLPAAIDIAVSQSHKIYDCLYLALALERREPLATADRRMAAIARVIGIEAQLIEPA